MKAKRLDSDEVNISDQIDSLRNKNNQNWNGKNVTTVSITVTSRVSAALVTEGYFPFTSEKRSKPWITPNNFKFCHFLTLRLLFIYKTQDIFSVPSSCPSIKVHVTKTFQKTLYKLDRWEWTSVVLEFVWSIFICDEKPKQKLIMYLQKTVLTFLWTLKLEHFGFVDFHWMEKKVKNIFVFWRWMTQGWVNYYRSFRFAWTIPWRLFCHVFFGRALFWLVNLA